MDDPRAVSDEDYRKMYSIDTYLDIPCGERFYLTELGDANISDLVRGIGPGWAVDEKGVIMVRGLAYTLLEEYATATLYDGEGSKLPDDQKHRAVLKEIDQAIEKRLRQEEDRFMRDNPDAIWS